MTNAELIARVRARLIAESRTMLVEVADALEQVTERLAAVELYETNFADGCMELQAKLLRVTQELDRNAEHCERATSALTDAAKINYLVREERDRAREAFRCRNCADHTLHGGTDGCVDHMQEIAAWPKETR